MLFFLHSLSKLALNKKAVCSKKKKPHQNINSPEDIPMAENLKEQLYLRYNMLTQESLSLNIK